MKEKKWLILLSALFINTARVTGACLLSALCILKESMSPEDLHPLGGNVGKRGSRVRLHRKWVNMIIKGVSDIRGVHGMNTRPGPVRESKAFLELYQLATEKEHLMSKLQRIRHQKDQTEKRLAEIGYIANAVEKKRATRKSTVHADFRSRFLEY